MGGGGQSVFPVCEMSCRKKTLLLRVRCRDASQCKAIRVRFVLFSSLFFVRAAGGHSDRTDFREHGHWLGAGVRHQGLPVHHHPAREDEQRKGQPVVYGTVVQQ